MEKKYLINKNQSDDLYISMKLLHDTLLEHKIEYFMVGGTLLGAIRHQGVIPHDDDGDICIFKKDVSKLRKLINYFDDIGYVLEEGLEEKQCHKRKNSCTWFFSSKKKHAIGIDIFVMFKKGDKITYYDPYWETASNGGQKCYFSEELLFPLLPYRFGNYYLYGPHNAIEHLNRCYGQDWNSKGQVLFDHRTGVFVESEKKDLKTNDFLTLKPPTQTCDMDVPNVICKKKNYFSKKSPKKSLRKASKKASKKSSRKSKKSN